MSACMRTCNSIHLREQCEIREQYNTDRNYGQSLVMTNQISNLSKQSFPEICRNDRSLNETIWTPKCDKLHVLDMVEKMKRKTFVHWILSLNTTKFYEAKVDSFCMGKLLIKIYIYSENSFGKNPFISFFLFTINFFSGKKRKPIKRLKIIHFIHHSPPCKCSYTCAIYYQFHKWAVNFDMQRCTVDNDCSFAVKL